MQSLADVHDGLCIFFQRLHRQRQRFFRKERLRAHGFRRH